MPHSRRCQESASLVGPFEVCLPCRVVRGSVIWPFDQNRSSSTDAPSIERCLCLNLAGRARFLIVPLWIGCAGGDVITCALEG